MDTIKKQRLITVSLCTVTIISAVICLNNYSKINKMAPPAETHYTDTNDVIKSKTEETVSLLETTVSSLPVDTYEPIFSPLSNKGVAYEDISDYDVNNIVDGLLERENTTGTYYDGWSDERYKYIDFSGHVPKPSSADYNIGDVLGYVTCESAKLDHVPITFGWTQDVCDAYQICIGSALNKTLAEDPIGIICGHNNRVLKNLKYAAIGDSIVIETTYGANYRYAITTSCKGVVQESWEFDGFTDVNSNWIARTRENSDDIVIFTCFDQNVNRNRWVVRGEKVEGTTVG